MANALQTTIRSLCNRLVSILNGYAEGDYRISCELDEEGKKNRIKEVRKMIKVNKTKIEKAILDIENKNMDYVQLLEKMTGDIRKAETTMYDAFAKGNNGFLELINMAKDRLDQLDLFDMEVDEIETDFFGQNSNLAERTFGNNKLEFSGIKLPEIKLPIFDGEYDEWNGFLEEFLATIDEQDIPEKRKFQYLKSSLKGEPLEIANKYPLEAKNYKLVLDILKKTFGDKQNIKISLFSRLKRLQRSGKFVPDQKKTLREMEAIINQLKNEGENVEHPPIVLEVESKLPKEMLVKVFKKRQNDENFGVEKILKFWNNQLKLEEDCYRAHRNFDFRNEEERKNRKFNFEKRGTGMYAFTGKNTCYFCGEKHEAHKCQKYSTNEERIGRLKETKGCFKCFSNGHRSKDCENEIRCFICRKNHNSALCRNNWEKKKLCMATEKMEDGQNSEVEFNTILMNSLVNVENFEEKLNKKESKENLVKEKEENFIEKRSKNEIDFGLEQYLIAQEMYSKQKKYYESKIDKLEKMVENLKVEFNAHKGKKKATGNSKFAPGREWPKN